MSSTSSYSLCEPGELALGQTTSVGSPPPQPVYSRPVQTSAFGSNNSSTNNNSSSSSSSSSAAGGEQASRRGTLSLASRVQASLTEPAEFIQRLASQCQLLACLKWLGEFQVLACIPLTGSTSTKEVADLAGVPEAQLRRVARMTATAGFLYEPLPDHIAHTALSAPFVTNLPFLDAALFLAQTTAPASLHMGAGSSDRAYALAFNTSQPFESACTERVKLRRQWLAFSRCTKDKEPDLIELLGRLSWQSLGNACIVHLNAPSAETAISLAVMCPSLRFVVQMDASTDTGPTLACIEDAPDPVRERITVETRVPAAMQTVNDAAIYILCFSSPSSSLRSQILAELKAHLRILRANSLATLILAPPMLPAVGSVEPDIEAMARSRDLSRLQLSNEWELEMEELTEMINGVCDDGGRLAVVNKLQSHTGATAAVGIKYERSLMDFYQSRNIGDCMLGATAL